MKGLSKKLSLLAFILLGAACATAPVEQKINANALDERLKEHAKSMNMSVHSVLETNFKGGSCSALVSKVHAKWNWADAVNAANSCFKTHEFTTVEDLANELAVHDTSTPWGPYFLSRVALERNQYERALWMVELSLKRAPNFGVTHYLKGQILWAQKDYKNATSEFEKSVQFDDGIGPAHLILGQIYLRDQDFNHAAPQFAQAIKLLGESVVALNGEAESQVKLNNPSRALDDYVRLSELDEADGQYLTHIGELYEGPLNNPERALNAYQKLHDMIKTGKIRKNIDPDNDSKIKELQAALDKTRSVASTPTSAKSGGGKK